MIRYLFVLFPTHSLQVHHYYSDHSSAGIANVTQRPMLLKVVDEPEASYVRSQIKMLQEKAYSSQFAERCVCVECHLSGNMPSLKAHWKAMYVSLYSLKSLLY